jgi:hypothetical protein
MSRHGFKARQNDARRLMALEQENSRLKRLLADAMLDNVILKDLLGRASAAMGTRCEANP